MKEYVIRAVENQPPDIQKKVLKALNVSEVNELYSFSLGTLISVIKSIIKDIDNTDVRIDANFADFPIFSPSRGETALVITTETGYVRMSNAFGLPTSIDADVFLAMLKIAKSLGFPEVVHFSITHIADMLKVPKSLVSSSIERLGSTNYLFINSYYYEGERITVKRGGITLFEYELWTPDSGVSRRRAFEKNWFRLNEFIMNNIAKYYVKVNFEIFRQLSPIAKRLYLLVEHRMQRRNAWSIDTKKLMAQIPILTYTKSGKYSTALKLLKRALLQLKGFGIISAAKFMKNGILIIEK